MKTKRWLSLLLAIMFVFAFAAPVSAADLVAGQHHYVGTVTAAIDGDDLLVTFATYGGCLITEAHVAVAEELSGIPQTKKGNPIPGQFPYKMTSMMGVTMQVFRIPLGDMETPLIIAAHAVVQCSDGCCCLELNETAWGGCMGFPGRNWARYFVYDPAS